MTRAAWLGAATDRLAQAGVPDPQRDARLLLRGVLGVDAAKLAQALVEPGTAEEEVTFSEAVARRARREPVSHILGSRLFWGRAFKVTPDVLDPRPETECLIAEALHRGPFRRVLDLGTGSGCLLLTLLAEWPEATGLGVDQSAAALAVASENSLALGLEARAEFCQSDWLAAVEGTFDLIVSNPPYLAESEYAGLSKEVRNYEPRSALIAAEDGLAAYREIATSAGQYLAKHGLLLLEIGPTQSEEVTAILAAQGWTVRGVIPDLDQRPRVVSAVR